MPPKFDTIDRPSPPTLRVYRLRKAFGKPNYYTWTSACKRYGWPSDVSKISDASLRDKAREELKGLPYCNVHNGMVFPPDSCLIEDASKSEGWPDAPRYSPNPPCRVSLDLSGSWSQYEIKLQHLRKMAAELAKAKVNVLVLQEVFDEDAVRQILQPNWEVRSTRGYAGSRDIPQHLAVAYPKDNPARVRNIQAYGDLSQVGPTRHAVRPGLDFTADVGGKPVRFLGVHLKAGCRSADITNPVKRDYHTAEDYEPLQSECNAMLAQVPVLACVLKSSGTYKRQDGKKIVDEVASLAHDGIDHVLVSAALAQRLNKTSFVFNRYNYRRTGETTPMIVTPQDAVPSDPLSALCDTRSVSL